MPVLLILLMVIFGSLAAASLPVAIGGVAILGSFTVLRLLTMATTVSVYSVNITTILGLGLGIDYGLFMVTRFREELHRQPTVEQAVARTVATAGRTVAVSGVTVAVALTSLMLFPEDFLRSMGYGGVATVAVDMLAALTVLPALLAVLGHRVNALRIRRSVQRPVGPARDETSGAWYRLAHSVMRRPVVYATVIVIGLLALGAPFLRISWGGTDARTLPAASTVRQVSQTLDRDFPVNSTAPIEALVTLPRTGAAAALDAYLHRIEAIPGVTGAQVTGVKAARGIRGGRPPRWVRRPGRHRLRRRPRCRRRPGTSSPRSATPRRRPARPCWSAGPPPGWWTNWPAWARRCPGWRCWSASRRSCCCSWRSARWCCRSRRS